jgi:hypothetical protein
LSISVNVKSRPAEEENLSNTVDKPGPKPLRHASTTSFRNIPRKPESSYKAALQGSSRSLFADSLETRAKPQDLDKSDNKPEAKAEVQASTTVPPVATAVDPRQRSISKKRDISQAVKREKTAIKQKIAENTEMQTERNKKKKLMVGESH